MVLFSMALALVFVGVTLWVLVGAAFAKPVKPKGGKARPKPPSPAQRG